MRPHLVVHFAQRRRHLVGQRAGHDHDVALPRAGSENHPKPVEVVPRSASVHHLHCAASPRTHLSPRDDARPCPPLPMAPLPTATQ